jgi:uncharacterized membrane protein
MKEQGKPLIQTIFLSVLWASLIITIIGGIYYLSQHGMEKHNYLRYNQEPATTSSIEIWKHFLNTPSSGIIMIGILILLLSQLLRVALITWYYANLRDFKFIGFSLFLLGILIYSFFATW